MALAPLNQALMFLVAHGHRHYETPEGILVQGEVCQCYAGNDRLDDDRWFQEPQVFPIIHGELVDMKPMRDWLGY